LDLLQLDAAQLGGERHGERKGYRMEGRPMSAPLATDPATLYREAVEKGIDPREYMDRKYAETIPEAERCERCTGTGNELMWMYRRCKACEGTGRSRGNEHEFTD
jgi:hypothetical protein